MFLKLKVGKTICCCKISIFNIMITSDSGLPQKMVLLKIVDSEIILKDFQSIKESISSSLSATDYRYLDSSLRVK